jgi:SAM-dependent methyltransferase
MRSTERFTGLANLYGQARPTYPPELVRWCLEQVPAPGLIVDLGCGTGISTRLFASAGHPVIGIDPNADMLATARAEGVQDYRVGTSEQSGLPDACAASTCGFITAAGASARSSPLQGRQ